MGILWVFVVDLTQPIPNDPDPTVLAKTTASASPAVKPPGMAQVLS